MRTIRFLLLILLSFSITCAWADIAPLPWGKRPQRPQERDLERNLREHPAGQQGPGSLKGPQTKDTDTRVSLMAANVQVRIHKMKTAPGAAGKYRVCSPRSRGNSTWRVPRRPKQVKTSTWSCP